MRTRQLTLGIKLGISTSVLAAIQLATAGLGISSFASLKEAFDATASRTARKLQLAGTLNTAESDMAVAQQGVILFTFAKEPKHGAESKRLFRNRAANLRATLAELKPASGCKAWP